MRDLAVLFLHLLTTIARLAALGGARAVVAESVLVKHQLVTLNRSRRWNITSVRLPARADVPRGGRVSSAFVDRRPLVV
jgi:hypothetical protein